MSSSSRASRRCSRLRRGIGAPLGHDFCAISLSDNLKPWTAIEKRLRLACEADFAIALYNPASLARPEGIHRAFEVLRQAKPGNTVIVFARAIGREDERMLVTDLAAADPGTADMQTLSLWDRARRESSRESGAALGLHPAQHGASAGEGINRA